MWQQHGLNVKDCNEHRSPTNIFENHVPKPSYPKTETKQGMQLWEHTDSSTLYSIWATQILPIQDTLKPPNLGSTAQLLWAICRVVLPTKHSRSISHTPIQQKAKAAASLCLTMAAEGGSALPCSTRKETSCTSSSTDKFWLQVPIRQQQNVTATWIECERLQCS